MWLVMRHSAGWRKGRKEPQLKWAHAAGGTHVVMSQSVEPLPASFLLGREVEVGQDLTRGAGTPLCGCREKSVNVHSS